jgi:hypothetical protein
MAVRAICFRTDIERDLNSTSAINVAVTVVIIGSQTGNYVDPKVPMNITNVDVSGNQQMITDISVKVKTELEANGVTFIPSDSVQVL